MGGSGRPQVKRLHNSFATTPWQTGAAWIATGALMISCRFTGVMVPKPGHPVAWIINGIFEWFLLAGGIYIVACKMLTYLIRRPRRPSSIGVIHQFFEREQERRK
jgi:hypothetical protein